MANKESLVSVLIVTYNHEKFLKESIDSVLMQDYPNVQIVVTDDCSTDGTQKIIKEYMEKYPEKIIGVFSEVNRGVTANCNAGLKKCSGDYVFTFSGDDVMLEGAISSLAHHMDDNPDCSICYANVEVFDEVAAAAVAAGVKRKPRLYNNLLRKARQGGVRVLIEYGCFNAACCTMIRSSKMPKEGFDESLPFASDWFFNVKVLINGGEIRYVDKVLARYRRHDDNVTQKYMREAVFDSMNACSYIIVNYPEYSREALHGYAINLRMLRGLDKKYYLKFLIASLRISFKIETLGAVLIYFLSFFTIKV